VGDAQTEPLRIPDRTVLAVFAHPDDESLACGGTLARLADAGVRVVLLCASRGESGPVSDAALIASRDLAAVRSDELRAAAHTLGIADADVLIGEHPDGDLRWADVSELHGEIVAAIKRYRPDGVITFPEDGLYWHLDHIGVHERTITAIRSFGSEAPPLYYITIPQGLMRAVVEAGPRGEVTGEGKLWGIEPDVFGVAAKPPTFVIDVRAWVPRKLAALACHRTQVGPGHPFARLDPQQARRLLGLEHFRRAPTDSRWESIIEQIAEPVPSA
jgi:N-acetyl-1-D-myo-inositol-2-amino-2-deoxy-alpha-D-glucopyranoside deacetylase